MYNEPVRDYFKEYTESAAIMSYTFDGTYQKDSSGTVCLPSGDSRTITMYMRNPQKYTLTLSASFPETAEAARTALVEAGTDTPLTVTQSTSDLTQITAVISSALITKMDMGGDISLTIGLTEPISGRSFASYTVPLHANTPPTEPDGAVVCVNTAVSPNTYIICFNMPAASKMSSSGTQGDITSVTINGTSYPLTVSKTDGTFAFSDTTGAITQSAPSGLAANTESGSGLSFTAKGQPVYLVTSDALSTDDKEYTITVADSAGLVSSVTTSVCAAKLGDVYMTDSSGTTITDTSALVQDDDSSYCTVNICPPATSTNKDGVTYDTSDAKVLYEVYKGTDATGTLLFTGESTGGKVTVKVPAGKIYINAYARKSLWADSDTLSDACSVTATRVFVDPSFTGTSTGSRDYPFTTIADAFASLDNKTNSANTITLLGAVTENIDLTSSSYSETAYTATIKADSGTATLTGTMNIKGGSSLAFKNIVIQGGNSSDSAAAAVTVNENAVLTVDGATRVKGGYVYIDNDLSSTSNTQGYIITGTSFDVSDIDTSANEYALLIVPASYENSVISALYEVKDASGTLAQTTATALGVNANGSDSYYIYSDDGTGYITERGAHVKVSFNGGDYTSVVLTASSTYVVGKTVTLTLGSDVPSGTAITSVKLYKLDGTDSGATTASASGVWTLTLPTSPASYELYVAGTVPYGSGTAAWSASKQITVVYSTSD